MYYHTYIKSKEDLMNSIFILLRYKTIFNFKFLLSLICKQYIEQNREIKLKII